MYCVWGSLSTASFNMQKVSGLVRDHTSQQFVGPLWLKWIEKGKLKLSPRAGFLVTENDIQKLISDAGKV